MMQHAKKFLNTPHPEMGFYFLKEIYPMYPPSIRAIISSGKV
jgi:hypothetical protein